MAAWCARLFGFRSNIAHGMLLLANFMQAATKAGDTSWWLMRCCMRQRNKPAICFSLPRAQHESSHICCRGWHSLPQGNSGSLQEASAAAWACGLHDSGQQGNSCWSWHVRLAATTDTLHRVHDPWCCCGAGQAQHHWAAAVGSSAAQIMKCGAVEAGLWAVTAQTP